MNQLNKNRLIGGGVLLFAGLLFAPTLLTPEPHTLTNPTLAVQIDSNNPQAKPSQNVAAQSPAQTPTAPAQPTLQLESIDAPVAAAPKNSTANSATAAAKPMPVVLESAADLSKSQPTATAKPSAAPGSWLRVGSFSSKANAKQLSDQLKQKGYAVKVEVIKVDGKNYRRVLVGPFRAEKQLQSALKRIRAEGYKPSIQR